MINWYKNIINAGHATIICNHGIKSTLKFRCILSFYIHDKRHTLSIYLHGFFLWGGTKSLCTAVTSGLLYKPQMIDEGDCEAIGGMKTGRGNRSTRRKPAPTPLCSPQNPTWPDPGSNPGRRGGKSPWIRYSQNSSVAMAMDWMAEVSFSAVVSSP
jgi:hypothetical protein